jgi:hypothetical protein
VVEKSAGDESACRQEDERHDEPFVMLIQRWSDEAPDLVHHERGGKHDPGNQRDLHVHRKRFAWLGVDKRTALGQHRTDGPEYEIKDRIDIHERDHHAHADSGARIDDAAPELVEVGQDRQAQSFVCVLVAVRSIEIAPTGKGHLHSKLLL